MSASPPAAGVANPAAPASRGRTASARAGRRAARGSGVVERELLVHGRARPPARASAALGADSRPPPRRPSRKPIGCSRSSARWASRPAVRARIGTALTAAAGKPRSSITAAIGIETFMVSGRPQASATASRKRAPSATCGPLTPRSSASSRIRSARGSSGLCTGWPKPGSLAAARTARISRATPRVVAGGARLRRLEQPRALLGGAEDHRAGAEDPGGDGALQRVRVGGQRHPRGDVGGHHPVLGDRDEQQVEEVALVLGRLAAGEQQVEVLGERQPAHQLAASGRGRAPRRGRGRPG